MLVSSDALSDDFVSAGLSAAAGSSSELSAFAAIGFGGGLLFSRENIVETISKRSCSSDTVNTGFSKRGVES